MLSEAGKHYGDNIIGEYANKLKKDLNKKYNERTLRRYRQFYNFVTNLKWSSLPTKLSWSHITELMVLSDQDEINYYIDLLLYNIKYKCYVVVELKVTELNKEHTGQIMTFMNYIDRNIKTLEENDTVGIIICKQDNEYVIKYCSDDRIIAREYELV